MVDKYHDPLLTSAETARHLEIPLSMLHGWLSERRQGLLWCTGYHGCRVN
jgi:hypothetical protein